MLKQQVTLVFSFYKRGKDFLKKFPATYFRFYLEAGNAVDGDLETVQVSTCMPYTVDSLQCVYFFAGRVSMVRGLYKEQRLDYIQTVTNKRIIYRR